MASVEEEPVRLPLLLTREGCFGFTLTPHSAQENAALMTASPGLAAGAVMLGNLFDTLPAEAQALSLEVDLGALLAGSSAVDFPKFTGDAGRAFDYIERQLGFDAHSERLDEAALSRIRRPPDIPEAAWQQVTDQLDLEIHYRFLCGQHFNSLMTFTQNAFVPNVTLVDTVGSLIQLNGDDILHLAVSGLFNVIAATIGGLSFTGAGVVGGALDFAFQTMLSDRGPSQAELTVALNGARDRLKSLFNEMISAVQKLRSSVFNDWGKLQEMGKSLEGDGGRWPDDDRPMREEVGRQLEISLWKALLKVKWHHMRADNDPTFQSRYSDARKAHFEDLHRNHWVKYWSGTQKDMFGKKHRGYFIEDHWLGYGNRGYWHQEPDPAMCDRLFGTLGIPRSEVFTESSWALIPETLYVDPPPTLAQQFE